MTPLRVFALLVLASCRDATSAAPSPAVIEVTSPTLTLQIGEHVRLAATVKDAEGSIVQNQHPSWSTTNAAVISVNDSGQATAVTAGTASISASVGAVRGSLSLTVQTAVVKLEIHGPPLTLGGNYSVVIGEAAQLSAIAKDALDQTVPNPSLVWATEAAPSNEARGQVVVDSTGRVTGAGSGWIYVTVASGLALARAHVYVHAPIASLSFGADSLPLILGSSVVLAAGVLDVNGKALDFQATASLTIADPSIVSIGTGLSLFAARPGTTVIVAKYGSTSVSLPITVLRSVRLASVAQGGGTTGNHACGLTDTGQAVCWGNNETFQSGAATPLECFGLANQYCDVSPARFPVFAGGNLRFVQISAGHRHTCAITASGSAYCWGLNNTGQLGTATSMATCYGSFAAAYVGPCTVDPVSVDGDIKFKSIIASRDRTCGLATSGDAYCWGTNSFIPPGSQIPALPVRVGGTLQFRSLVLGSNDMCGIASDGTAYCWGDNTYGQLGLGSADASSHATPVVVSLGRSFSEVSVGSDLICGLGSDGRLSCAGDVQQMQVGAPDACPVPGQEPSTRACSTRFISIPSEYVFSTLSDDGAPCAMTAAGAVFCWSHEFQVQPPKAALVSGAPPFKTLSTAPVFTGCGIGIDGVVYCWGGDLIASRAPGQP